MLSVTVYNCSLSCQQVSGIIFYSQPARVVNTLKEHINCNTIGMSQMLKLQINNQQ